MAKFSKRHYESIARILPSHYNTVNPTNDYETGYKDGRWSAISSLADMFEQDNPRFDRERFIKAVRGESNKRNKLWEVQGNYGQGWECLTTEENCQEATKRLQEYTENEPSIPHRVKPIYEESEE
jgi:hypothetical protein